MAEPSGSRECLPETPDLGRQLKRTHASVTNLRSHSKRRRMSIASVDLGRGTGLDDMPLSVARSEPSTDRFISFRSNADMPLNLTPRTRRLSERMGLSGTSVLSFKENTGFSSLAQQEDDKSMALLRKSATALFQDVPKINPRSVTENLGKQKQCLSVLDSPGVASDPDMYPISWSRKNCIAVVCKNDIFYQNLDTKSVTHLCNHSFLVNGNMTVIEWGAEERRENHLAVGDTRGTASIYDAGTQGGKGKVVSSFHDDDNDPVRCMAWAGSTLAVGSQSSYLSLIDIRSSRRYIYKRHRAPLLSVKVSTDDNYIATGDRDGSVYIWDRRADKVLLDSHNPLHKMRHKGKVKALAWCPWKPELLATGSGAPEGKIRIWNVNGTMTAQTYIEPIHTIELSTAVTSLQWSPHCQELLSTHAQSFVPVMSASRRRVLGRSGVANRGLGSGSGTPSPGVARATTTTTLTRPGATVATARATAARRPTPIITTTTPYTNSILVHQFPSMKPLLVHPNAHTAEITHSCLSPDGESLFTVCPKEETIKMWHVWRKGVKVARRESAFDRFTIR